MVKKLAILLVVAVVSSLVTTYVLGARVTADAAPRKSSELPLLNAIVLSAIHKHFIVNFQPLREAYLDIAERHSGEGYIYFSYLNNAAWIGINEREKITAASTVKVPLAMAAFKAVEEGRITGEEVYTIEQDDLNDGFGDLYKGGVGDTLPLRELLKIMLVHSDNTASNAVVDVLRRVGVENPLEPVYMAMGWEIESAIGEVPSYGLIHMKVLSNMFLSLYNATYVNAQHSEEILEHLANSPFSDKIVAGVPAGVTVAHKIGVYAESHTYSDCGIVYVPDRNYLLCIASVGVDEKEAAAFMKEVSRATYEYVTTH